VYSEEEQVEVIKEWWQKNGTTVLVTIVGVLALVVGYNWWNANQKASAQAASYAYEEMLQGMAIEEQSPSAGNRAQLQSQAEKVIAEHGNTGYAQLAHLALAQIAVAEQDYASAAEQLETLLADKPRREVADIARLRLARLQLELEQPEKALKTLEKTLPEAWTARVLELRGDAYLQQQNQAQALRSYDDALAQASPEDAIRERIQMKRDDLAPAS